MKIALTVWNNRIAPVFDVSRHLVILELEQQTSNEQEHHFGPEENLTERIAKLKELGIDVLICGAISHPAYLLAESLGIEVNSFIAGEIAEVLAAWREKRLETKEFAMPGCGGGDHRRHCCRRRRMARS